MKIYRAHDIVINHDQSTLAREVPSLLVSARRLHCVAQVERVDEIQRLDAEKQQVNNAASAVSK